MTVDCCLGSGERRVKSQRGQGTGKTCEKKYWHFERRLFVRMKRIKKSVDEEWTVLLRQRPSLETAVFSVVSFVRSQILLASYHVTFSMLISGNKRVPTPEVLIFNNNIVTQFYCSFQNCLNKIKWTRRLAVSCRGSGQFILWVSVIEGTMLSML